MLKVLCDVEKKSIDVLLELLFMHFFGLGSVASVSWHIALDVSFDLNSLIDRSSPLFKYLYVCLADQ